MGAVPHAVAKAAMANSAPSRRAPSVRGDEESTGDSRGAGTKGVVLHIWDVGSRSPVCGFAPNESHSLREPGPVRPGAPSRPGRAAGTGGARRAGEQQARHPPDT
ncbi:hypothetical protein GCM10022205_12890 [Spinactinospora alkalitolerans]